MDRGGALFPFDRRHAGACRLVPRPVLLPGAAVYVWVGGLFGAAASAVRSARPDLCARMAGAVPRAAPLVRGGYGAGHPVFVELPRDGGTRRDRGDHQRF